MLVEGAQAWEARGQLRWLLRQLRPWLRGTSCLGQAQLLDFHKAVTSTFRIGEYNGLILTVRTATANTISLFYELIQWRSQELSLGGAPGAKYAGNFFY